VSLVEALLIAFPDQMEFQGVEDPGTTGNFNVFVDGVLVHSKRASGGRAEMEAEREFIIVYIRNFALNRR
jgi:selT/selW/selH-like putative selenoprotein